MQHAREEEIAERKAMKRAERDIARKKEFVRRVRLQIEEKRAEVNSCNFPKISSLLATSLPSPEGTWITQPGYRVPFWLEALVQLYILLLNWASDSCSSISSRVSSRVVVAIDTTTCKLAQRG